MMDFQAGSRGATVTSKSFVWCLFRLRTPHSTLRSGSIGHMVRTSHGSAEVVLHRDCADDWLLVVILSGVLVGASNWLEEFAEDRLSNCSVVEATATALWRKALPRIIPVQAVVIETSWRVAECQNVCMPDVGGQAKTTYRYFTRFIRLLGSIGPRGFRVELVVHLRKQQAPCSFCKLVKAWGAEAFDTDVCSPWCVESEAALTEAQFQLPSDEMWKLMKAFGDIVCWKLLLFGLNTASTQFRGVPWRQQVGSYRARRQTEHNFELSRSRIDTGTKHACTDFKGLAQVIYGDVRAHN